MPQIEHDAAHAFGFQFLYEARDIRCRAAVRAVGSLVKRRKVDDAEPNGLSIGARSISVSCWSGSGCSFVLSQGRQEGFRGI